MKNLYHVSASPHVRSSVSTAGIMRDVAIALAPACLFGIWQFGFRAFLVLLVSVTTCMISEYLFYKLSKKKKGPYECSAVVTGLLLGMNLPASVPLWMPVLGGIFAIIVVKELYGGLGQNFMNPALAARCFLLICFASRMAAFSVEAGSGTFMNGAAAVDGLSSATPLAVIKEGTEQLFQEYSLSDMFFGFTGGVIGETSTLMILIGAAYLLVRGVISLRIPAAYLGSFAVFILLFGGHGADFSYLAAQLCGGGLMLGAFFMATDYVTSPVTPAGRIVFGVCLGILTGIFRVFGSSAEGVSYAIIFCNLLVPLIEKVTMPRAFGKGGKQYVRK